MRFYDLLNNPHARDRGRYLSDLEYALDIPRSDDLDYQKEITVCRNGLGLFACYNHDLCFAAFSVSDEPTGVTFHKKPMPYMTSEWFPGYEAVHGYISRRFVTYPNGWHRIHLNKGDLEKFRKKLDLFCREDERLKERLYEAGLMYLSIREYWKVQAGFYIEEDGNAREKKETSQTIEEQSDRFSIDQFCKCILSFHRTSTVEEKRKAYERLFYDTWLYLILAGYIYLDTTDSKERKQDFLIRMTKAICKKCHLTKEEWHRELRKVAHETDKYESMVNGGEV